MFFDLINVLLETIAPAFRQFSHVVHGVFFVVIVFRSFSALDSLRFVVPLRSPPSRNALFLGLTIAELRFECWPFTRLKAVV